MHTLDSVPHRIRPARGEPEGALVLLHGRGTDEHDLFPLLDLLDPDARLVGVTPRGPLSLPPGGAHWYIVREVGYPDRETFMESFALLSSWLEALPGALGFPAAALVLGGFSQGCVMSYSLALGAESSLRPAALVALSGFIPKVEGFELDLEERRLPVAIGHGTFDPIIPVQFGREARDLLERAGFHVVYRESPMAHSVDPEYLAELARWLKSVE